MKPGRLRRPPSISLSAEEVQAGVNPGGVLFLGRYDEAAIRKELTDAGILPALAERGYPELRVRIHVEPGEHRLRLVPARGRISLLDLRLAETTASIADPRARRHGLDVLSFLAVHWLSLQNPKARFTAERPRLPGQTYPGLGLSRRVYERLHFWARTWGKDGLVNRPEYFHNAVFYSAIFRFLAAERQGRFEALRRDLGHLHVAAASAAVREGHVVERPSGGPLTWEPAEMVSPLTEPLQRFLASADYARAVAESRDAVRFEVRP